MHDSTRRKIKLGVLISGTGTNLKAIHADIRRGCLDNAEIACVISNKDSEGYKWASEEGLKAYKVELTKEELEGHFKQPVNRITLMAIEEGVENVKGDHERRVKKILEEEGVELVILAGYMLLVGEQILNAYPDKILNIHPSLLPSFPGAHGIKQAIDYGVKVTGVTVHMVDKGMDTGKILAQKVVQVWNNDTVEKLSKRIHQVEHALYPDTIRAFIDKSF